MSTVEQEEGQRALAALGLAVRAEWVATASAHIAREQPSYATWPAHRRSDALFALFLHADLNQSGTGSLPPDVQGMHKQKIVGRHVLQVDELLDIAKANRERYADAAGVRCLKMSLTDGVQRTAAIEYRPITAISSAAPAGLKIAVTDAFVKRGVMLLRPENVIVLGGQVERLERARQAMLAYWNRPLGGRPRPQQTGGRPPSSVEERAAMGQAAWAWESSGADAPSLVQNNNNLGNVPNGQQHNAPCAATVAAPAAPLFDPAAMRHPSTSQLHPSTASIDLGRTHGQDNALRGVGSTRGVEAEGAQPSSRACDGGQLAEARGGRSGAFHTTGNIVGGLQAPVPTAAALLPPGARGRLSLSQRRRGSEGAQVPVASQTLSLTQPSQLESLGGHSSRGNGELPICIEVSPERRRITDADQGGRRSSDDLESPIYIDSSPVERHTEEMEIDASPSAPASCPTRSLQPSGVRGPGTGGQRVAATPLLTLRALIARARALPAGQTLRPRPLHALLAGIEGRLRYRDEEGRPLHQYQFEVYLDDGSSKQRCRVASEVVQGWLHGIDSPSLAAMPETDRNAAIAKFKQFLMKAEGMWALEFSGGAGTALPLVLDMKPGIDEQLVAKLRARCRHFYPSCC